ncbi:MULTISPECIES: CE1759 family FMN reductase [Streptomyces]|uniref:CE1759 family FMN reductase n=1 Tax=Streptomyces eurythermus TaxID=42237 RepID=A0ABW6Z6F7_9ACTN|nr:MULTISPECIES: CE1759 family FMN reductase [Streptomyces]QIS75074.1 NADH-dependent FMN reductase [Streptomyces sp. DSM 40868]
MTTTHTTTPHSIVVISGGVSQPSSSRLLADRLAQKTLDLLRAHDVDAQVTTIELRTLVDEIGKATITGFVGDELRPAVDSLAAADAVITATPVYKAGVSGLFKAFVDLLDNDVLIAKPVAVTATAGSARHALVPDEQMRPLFAYMRALVIPTALFAAPEDWGDTALGARIERAATELAALMESGVARAITDGTWKRYQHTFGSSAQPAGAATEVSGVDFDSDLMRLATGGSARP